MKWNVALPNIIIVVIMTASFGLIGFLQPPCLFYAFFHIPCISCGLTRAWLSVFRLDFPGAFFAHPMFWAVPVLVLYVMADGKPFQKPLINHAALGAITFGFLVNYGFVLSGYL